MQKPTAHRELWADTSNQLGSLSGSEKLEGHIPLESQAII